MMEQANEQLIKEQLENLPEPVKKAIASFDWAREVFDIGRRNNLHVDTIGDIQTEVMLVVLGLISPKEFFDQMTTTIGLSRDIAEKVAEEVNAGVFIRIRKFLKDYYDADGKAESTINQKEKKILQSAGISVGDDALREEVARSFVPIEDGEVVKVVPNVVTAGAASAAPAPAKPAVASPAPAPKPAPAAPTAQIFRTKVAEIATADKPNNFFDPYREPIE